MEVFSVLIGSVFWPTVIIAWVRFSRKRRLRNIIRYAVTMLIVSMPLLGAFALSQYMFLDEPLVTAVIDGDVGKVRVLLKCGADPNIDVRGNFALEQAAAEGNVEMVRLLLAHGAQTNVRNEWNGRTALQAAEMNGYPEVAKLLKQAGATH
jgi:hypothetical protein